jgi:hypothetical protein
VLRAADTPCPGYVADALLSGERESGAQQGDSRDGDKPRRRFLYPMLEGALVTEIERRSSSIHEFDTQTAPYTKAKLDVPPGDPEHAIGDIDAVDKTKRCW